MPVCLIERIAAARAIRLKLPDAYVSTHDVFSVRDLWPWLHAPERRLELDYPDVVAHPTLNRVVQVMDRKRYGRAPRSAKPTFPPHTWSFVWTVLQSGSLTIASMKTKRENW